MAHHGHVNMPDALPEALLRDADRGSGEAGTEQVADIAEHSKKKEPQNAPFINTEIGQDAQQGTLYVLRSFFFTSAVTFSGHS